MNFIGHLYVALWRDARPKFWLGAMLPDFASMASARLSTVVDRDVASGVDLHHRTDEAFHGAADFHALVQEAIRVLTEHGVARGPARAVGHVGVEMLIDGELVRQSAVGSSYLSALAAFGELAPDTLGSAAHAPLAALVERLRRYGIPYDYEHPEAVTARLSSALTRRPRLALDARAQAVVGSIMPDLKARVVQRLPALLRHLEQADEIHAIRKG